MSLRPARALALAALSLAAASLAMVWILQPGDPPVYDGLPLGTPPYRYLVPPAGRAATAPPSSATKTFVVSANPYGFQLETSEPVAQASILVPKASLVIPPGVTRISVSITPVTPPIPTPAGSTIDGNVYRFEVATGGGQQLRLRAKHTVTVMLRHTGSPGRPAVAVVVGTRWVSLKSVEEQVGTSTAASPALGDMALVLSTSRPSGPSSAVTAVVVVGAVLVVMALVLLVIGRVRHRRQRDRDRSDGA